MKKRIYLFTIAAVAILIAVAVGFCIWKNSNVAEVDAPSVPKLSEEVITEPSSTEIPETEAVFAPTEAEITDTNNQQSCNFERYQEPLLDYPSEIWDTTGDEWEVLPYTTADAISVDLFYRGFREVDLCGDVEGDIRTNRGTCEMRNVVYSSDGPHVQLEFTYVSNVGTRREISKNWVFRAEHTDEIIDFSGVGNPGEDVIWDSGDFVYCCGLTGRGYSKKYEEGEQTSINVKLFYSKSTGNMYSIVEEDTIEAYEKTMTLNNGEIYNPGFFDVTLRSTPYAIEYPLSRPSTYEFTVKYPDTEETKTYTFKIGSTYNEWVSSQYNTDGWRADPKDKTKIISADSKYSLPANVKIQNKITARANT